MPIVLAQVFKMGVSLYKSLGGYRNVVLKSVGAMVLFSRNIESGIYIYIYSR